MLHAKVINCDIFEMGQQFFHEKSFDISPTEKEFGIAKFKAGFGGNTKFSLLFSSNI